MIESSIGQWLVERKWGMRLLAGIFLVGSPFIITYYLWQDEWEHIKDAYADAVEAFKTGEPT